MLASIYGHKTDIRRHGDALILCVWIQGIPAYGMFCDIEGICAWIKDNTLILDYSESQTITVKLAA